MSSYSEAMTGTARLYILRELAQQTDGRLNEVMLHRTLDMYGIRRARDWVKTQLRKLESLGAIELSTAGDLFVAKILRAGRDHLDEREVIEGIARPLEAD